ncbi:MAG: adenine methyltransferase, partial [Thermoproteota archaeon]
AINHLGEGKVFEIDTTGKTVEEVVREAERVVLERKGPRPGSVDWTHLAGLV